MTEINQPDSTEALSLERVSEAVREVSHGGQPQRLLATKLDIPVQYLSDYKNGRRKMSERVARRFEELHGFQWLWLLGRSDVKKVDPAPKPQTVYSIQREVAILPVLRHPIEGDPRRHPQWDGMFAEVVGAAEAKLSTAKLPYVLRFGADDRENRFHAGDLLLMSQAPPVEGARIGTAIQVIRHGRGLYLARRTEEGWLRLASKEPEIALDQCTVHGHVLATIWASHS